jgi:hypothetical protein
VRILAPGKLPGTRIVVLVSSADRSISIPAGYQREAGPDGGAGRVAVLRRI